MEYLKKSETFLAWASSLPIPTSTVLAENSMSVEVCSSCHEVDTPNNKHCHNCGGCPKFQEVKNHSLMWHDGDIFCTLCDTFIREFDAG